MDLTKIDLLRGWSQPTHTCPSLSGLRPLPQCQLSARIASPQPKVPGRSACDHELAHWGQLAHLEWPASSAARQHEGSEHRGHHKDTNSAPTGWQCCLRASLISQVDNLWQTATTVSVGGNRRPLTASENEQEWQESRDTKAAWRETNGRAWRGLYSAAVYPRTQN